MSADHAERREHLERLLEDVNARRRVDTDELFMELIHVVFELQDSLARLEARIEHLEGESAGD